MEKVTIIDCYSLLFRGFFSVKELKNSKGIGTGMAFGMVRDLLIMCTNRSLKCAAKNLILAWDKKATRKKELFPDYKAKRTKEELPPKMSVPVQLRICKEIADALGLIQAFCDGEESDDVVATLSNHFSQKKIPNVIVSTDHDMHQCLNKYTAQIIHKDDSIETFTEDKFLIKNPFAPKDYWKAQALGGCGTDNVPGLRGISEETACWMINQNSWKDIISNSPNLVFPNKAAATRFKKGYPAWDHELMTKLVRLRTDLKPKIERPKFNKDKLRKLFLYLEFKQYLLPDNFDRICEVFG